MLRVLVFVTLIAWTHAGDGGFAPFCKEFLDENLVDEKTCKKEFNQVTDESAEGICQYWSRFAVNTADVDGNKLSCSWSITGECEEGHYILGRCYKLFSTCPGDWIPLPLSSRQAIRWIALTFVEQQLVNGSLPKKYTEPSVKYSRRQLFPLEKSLTKKSMQLVDNRKYVYI